MEKGLIEFRELSGNNVSLNSQQQEILKMEEFEKALEFLALLEQ